ncbi:MAG TPA: methyltransferase domain-containing protein [Pilimelia sp.]|nr:methyltransferase domain-containing protein [Pilimelia sp.]
MNADVTAYLRCPVCAGELAVAGGARPSRALCCPRGHSFDIARQGYAHLGTGRAVHSGDTAEMIAARAEFLAEGHYDVIPAAIADAAGDTGGLVVDAGSGTGHHLARVLDALPRAVGLALDVSKAALRRAARSHPRTAAVLCDTWGRLPLADGAAALVLNVFAPRNGPEFRRILRPDGRLFVVTPDADHLTELVDALDLLRVDPEKPARTAASLGDWFEPAGEGTHRRTLWLNRRQVRTVAGMGPSAWHREPAVLAERIARLPEPVAVTAAFRLTAYRPRR